MNKLISIMVIMLIIAISIYDYHHYDENEVIYDLKISNDGKYAISTNKKGILTLWDLESKKSSIISSEVNVYSPYFLRNNNFIWQDKNNIVYLMGIDGKKIKKFDLGEQVFSHSLTANLKYYYFSDGTSTIYKIENMDLASKVKFYNSNKLASKNNGHRIYFNYDETNLFYKSWLKGQSLISNIDNKDKNKCFIDKNPWEKYRLWLGEFSPNSNKVLLDGPTLGIWDNMKCNLTKINFFYNSNIKNFTNVDSGLYPKVPKDFKNYLDEESLFGIFDLKYIDTKGNFLIFIDKSFYAILHNEEQSIPYKFLSLRGLEFPVNEDVERNQAIDTAPNAGILVMAKKNFHGILVYKFDSDKKTLTKVWSSGNPYLNWFIESVTYYKAVLKELYDPFYYGFIYFFFGLSGLMKV